MDTARPVAQADEKISTAPLEPMNPAPEEASPSPLPSAIEWNLFKPNIPPSTLRFWLHTFESITLSRPSLAKYGT